MNVNRIKYYFAFLSLPILAYLVFRNLTSLRNTVEPVNKLNNSSEKKIEPLWISAGSSQEELDMSWIVEPSDDFWESARRKMNN